ncbi:DNA internalization-related competence protein ComEC/Rec2 [Acetobacterium sp.]|uniref:DNA internalization-related competence protein ComEC/Rec2 n=1 Tax=Acetobacterium sp. TaxID=1872094 RepID=UPI002F41FF69
MLWGFLALCFAIALYYYRVPLWGILLFGGLLGAMPLMVRGVKKTQIFFVLGLYLLGCVLGVLTFPVSDTLEDFYGTEVTISGVVSDSPKVEDYGVVFNLKTSDISNDKAAIKKPLGLKVTIPVQKGEAQSMPIAGDVLNIKGELSKPQGQRNPGGYDYGLYLKSKGIEGLVYVETGKVEKIGRDPSPFEGIIAFRIYLEKLSDTYLSENVSDLLKGVVFGGKDIDSDIKLSFQNAGVAHVLSVSGLHVGYVFLLISFFLTRFKIKKKHWLFYLIPALFFYIVMTGFESPVIRASIMLGSITLGQGIHREKDNLNNLCLAGIIILCLWPSQLFQPGFQLSMGAVLGIVLFYGPLLFQYKKQLNKKISRREKTPGPIIEGLALTCCATIGTLPMMFYHFKGFTLLSFFSNLIVVPLIGAFLLAGIIFLFIAGVLPFMASLLAMPLNFLGESILVVLSGINDIGDAFSFLWVRRGGLSITEMLLFIYLAFLITGYYHLRNPLVKKTVLIFGAVLGILLIVLPLFPKNLVVTVLDVGQGDSILIETPGGLNYLIDGGGYILEKETKISESIVLPVLYNKNINKLNGVFLSHNHVDHSQGIEELLEGQFPVDNLFMSVNTNNEVLLNQSAVPVSLLKKGSVIQGTDGVKLEILSPTGEVNPVEEENQNNASLVIRLSYGKTTLLLCGDIEKEVEEKLFSELSQESPARDIQMIKIPHHGSKTSSTQEFLTLVDPELAVISVGAYNTFGHPGLEVLERLKDQAVETLRTDQNGAVEMTSNGEWLRYKTYGNSQGEKE